MKLTDVFVESFDEPFGAFGAFTEAFIYMCYVIRTNHSCSLFLGLC